MSIFSLHCVKSVRMWCFSGPYLPAFELNTERYSVSLRIQSKCGKIWTRKTPNTDTFHAVLFIYFVLDKNNIEVETSCLIQFFIHGKYEIMLKRFILHPFLRLFQINIAAPRGS